MYITPRQRTRYFWTTIILILLLPITAFAAVMVIRYFIGASGETTPKNVIISNITSNSVSISWTTDSQSTGSVTVNSGKGDTAPFVDIRGTDQRKTHHVDIVDLEPSKDYSFTILSSDKRFGDEKGKSYKFRTSPVTSQTPVPKPVYGSVEGTDKNDVVVYIVVEGDKKVYPASSATTATGKWIVDLSALRDPASKDLVNVSSNTNIQIIAKGVDTLGGSINGTYQDLIDEEGQLKVQLQLSDIPTDSLFASLPANSQIASVASPTSKPSNDGNKDPVVTPPVDDGEDDDEVIAGDVEWTAIPGTRSNTSSAATGSESVQVTNLTDTGLNILWLSSNASEGSVKYGTNETTLSDTGIDERDSATSKGKYSVHSVRITRLQPETKYFYEIYDDLTLVKKGNITTFKTLSNPPEFKSVTGKISNFSQGNEAIVLFNLKSSSATSTIGSTLVDTSGNWVATIGDSRSLNGDSYFTYTDSDKLEITSLSLSNIKGVTLGVKQAVDSGASLASTSSTSRKIVKIPALTSYGLFSGRVSTTGSSGGETGGGADLDNGGNIPNTAISTPLLWTIVIGVVTVLASIYLYISSNRRLRFDKEKHNMISSVN